MNKYEVSPDRIAQYMYIEIVGLRRGRSGLDFRPSQAKDVIIGSSWVRSIHSTLKCLASLAEAKYSHSCEDLQR